MLATQVNGHMFVEPGADVQVEFVPNAGLRIVSLSSEDSGVYNVQVNLNLHGSIVTHHQTVNVLVTGGCTVESYSGIE